MAEKKKKRPAGKITAPVKKTAVEKKPVAVPVKAAAAKATPKATPKVVHSSVAQADFYRLVEQKAYELYVTRGGGHGNHFSDWCEAEMIVRSERSGL